nr:hypothetical protein Q903MT_gene949 [Picea sitchensis]
MHNDIYNLCIFWCNEIDHECIITYIIYFIDGGPRPPLSVEREIDGGDGGPPLSVESDE